MSGAPFVNTAHMVGRPYQTLQQVGSLVGACNLLGDVNAVAQEHALAALLSRNHLPIDSNAAMHAQMCCSHGTLKAD